MTAGPPSIRLVEGDARRFGEIELIARLGHGGMAEVFLAAKRARAGDLLVLKRLKADLDDPEHRAMFEEEARIMPLLTHPNIVRTTEVGEQAGQRYLAMEFLDGLPLDQCSPCITVLGERAVLHLVAELLEGLHYAHELRDKDGVSLDLVHRDVSPHNVFITFDGRVTLVDFGIAKSKARIQHTTTGVVRGKLSYMAPEQALCDALDCRADVFAAGVILWELLSGKRFWEGLSEVQILKRMTFGDMPKLETHLPDLGEDVARVLNKALAVKPEDRYATAREMRDDLAAVWKGPFRRMELGRAVAVQAESHRAALRDLVDRHLETARGTDGLPGISRERAEDDDPTETDAPPEIEPRVAPTLIDASEAPDAALAIPTPASSRNGWASRGDDVSMSARTPGEKPITETGGATILEVQPPARSRVSPLVYVAGVGVVAAALAAVIILPRSSPRDSSASENAGAVPATATAGPRDAPGNIEVRLRVTPETAVVHLDGMRVTSMPFVAKFPKDSAGHKLVVAADGYTEKSQIVVFDRDVDLAVELDAAAGDVAPGSSSDPVEEPPQAGRPRPRVPIRSAPAQSARSPSAKAAKSGAPASTGAPNGFIQSDPWRTGGTKKPPK